MLWLHFTQIKVCGKSSNMWVLPCVDESYHSGPETTLQRPACMAGLCGDWELAQSTAPKQVTLPVNDKTPPSFQESRTLICARHRLSACRVPSKNPGPPGSDELPWKTTHHMLSQPTPGGVKRASYDSARWDTLGSSCLASSRRLPRHLFPLWVCCASFSHDKPQAPACWLVLVNWCTWGWSWDPQPSPSFRKLSLTHLPTWVGSTEWLASRE